MLSLVHKSGHFLLETLQVQLALLVIFFHFVTYGGPGRIQHSVTGTIDRGLINVQLPVVTSRATQLECREINNKVSMALHVH